MFIKLNAFLFAFTIFLSLHAEENKSKTLECQSSKEFITTFNFLKSKKEFELPPQALLNTSKNVSNGCNGSANRFIKSVNTLIEAEVNTKKAIEISIKISNEDDYYAENFQNIFKHLYIEKYYDLPIDQALAYTIELTQKMTREPKKTLEDFNLLTDFCMGKNELDLSASKCSQFVKNTLLASKDFNVTLAKEIIKFYEFLTKEEKGPRLNTMEALTEIEDIVKFGPSSFANFKEAFIFATSPSGLSADYKSSFKLAKEIAAQSLIKK